MRCSTLWGSTISVTIKILLYTVIGTKWALLYYLGLYTITSSYHAYNHFRDTQFLCCCYPNTSSSATKPSSGFALAFADVFHHFRIISIVCYDKKEK